jgi:SAM-dependent methyltransferase
MNNIQLSKIRKAYDLTVEQYHNNIDPMDAVPIEFKKSPEFIKFEKEELFSSNSNSPENKEFLNPLKGMKFLDAGCCANLINYNLNEWSSIYYGVDISPKLINATKNYVKNNNINIGGLYIAEIKEVPFEDNFFDIASLIGVLEYVDLEYIESALKEMNRVLKSGSKMVVDIPNMDHSLVNVMFKLEEYLERPEIPIKRKDFEEILISNFKIKKRDDNRVMLKYFLETKK